MLADEFGFHAHFPGEMEDGCTIQVTAPFDTVKVWGFIRKICWAYGLDESVDIRIVEQSQDAESRDITNEFLGGEIEYPQG